MGQLNTVRFFGDRDLSSPSLTQPQTQPTQSEVTEAYLNASGRWMITVHGETGQTAITRIKPETTLILIDKMDSDE